VVALEYLRTLEEAIELRLGSLRGGVQPLLQEAHSHCSALAPAQGGQRPAPKEQQERQARLAEVLDQLEDILEALYLAVRAGPGASMSREASR
jgi:hypothetical protein